MADPLSALGQLIASGEPLLLVIAGPNGAGKTTFFEASLETRLRIPFVNADRIAMQLPLKGSAVPRDVVALQAATLMREQLLASRVSFCMETVFSDPVGDKLDFFRRAQAAGYFVSMIFIGLASVELSARRVENLRKAIRQLDQVIVLDNSEVEDLYREIANYEGGKAVWLARDPPAWFRKIKRGVRA